VHTHRHTSAPPHLGAAPRVKALWTVHPHNLALLARLLTATRARPHPHNLALLPVHSDKYVFMTMCGVMAAACVNGVFIIVFNEIYARLAIRLTEWENHRTQARAILGVCQRSNVGNIGSVRY
jgi:hypothetical protein